MLVLTRKNGESVVIDDDIVITVLGTRNGQVRLGISAPKTVTVHRKEVYHRQTTLKVDDNGSGVENSEKEEEDV